MGKTFSTGLLTDGISQDSSNNIGIGGATSGTNKFEVSGSTKLNGNTTITGSLSITGSATTIGNTAITGSLTVSSSANAIILPAGQTIGLGTAQIYTGTGGNSGNIFVQGAQTKLYADKVILEAATAAGVEVIGGTKLSGSFIVSGSATTIGNTVLSGSLNVSGSITSTSTITAQTLVVQTITSSVLYSSGSNIFGNALSNTQLMTGSVGITGSLAVNGTGTFSSNITATQLIIKSVSGTAALFLKDENANNKWEIGHISNNLYFYSYINSTIPLVLNGSTGAATFSGSLTGTIATFSTTLAANNSVGLINLSATGYGTYVRGGNSSNYALYVTDYNAGTAILDANLTRVALGVPLSAGYGGTFVIPVESPASGSVALVAKTSNGANDIFRWFDGTTQLGVFKNSGNVGIGTTSPSELLDVRNSYREPTSGEFTQLLSSTTTQDAGRGGSLGFGGFTNGTSGYTTFSGIKGFKENGDGGNTAGTLAFYTRVNSGAVTERMRISSTGAISGTPTVGYNAFQGIVSGGAIAFLSTLAATNDYSGYWQVAGNLAGSITHPTTTTTNYNVTSDYRLKENIVPLEGGIEAILKLNPISGNYKADPNKTNMPMFLAHEVQSVVPIAVTGKKDAVKFNKETGKEEMDIQQLDASKLIPHLVKAIQELSAKNDALQTRITQLENK